MTQRHQFVGESLETRNIPSSEESTKIFTSLKKILDTSAAVFSISREVLLELEESFSIDFFTRSRSNLNALTGPYLSSDQVLMRMAYLKVCMFDPLGAKVMLDFLFLVGYQIVVGFSSLSCLSVHPVQHYCTHSLTKAFCLVTLYQF